MWFSEALSHWCYGMPRQASEESRSSKLRFHRSLKPLSQIFIKCLNHESDLSYSASLSWFWGLFVSRKLLSCEIQTILLMSCFLLPPCLNVSMSLELKWEMSQFDGRDNIAGTDIVCFMVELIQLLSRLLKKDNNANSWLTTNILNKLNGSLATTETCFSYHQKQKLKEDLGLARATLVSIINTSSVVVLVVLLWSVSNVSVQFLLVVLLVV